LMASPGDSQTARKGFCAPPAAIRGDLSGFRPHFFPFAWGKKKIAIFLFSV